MNKVTTLRVARPDDRVTFPIVAYFYHTGEPLNPWRCECCIAPRHRAAYLKYGADMILDYLPQPAPVCCRKCGMEFAR